MSAVQVLPRALLRASSSIASASSSRISAPSPSACGACLRELSTHSSKSYSSSKAPSPVATQKRRMSARPLEKHHDGPNRASPHVIIPTLTGFCRRAKSHNSSPSSSSSIQNSHHVSNGVRLSYFNPSRSVTCRHCACR